MRSPLVLLAVILTSASSARGQGPPEVIIGTVHAVLPAGAAVVAPPHGRGRFGGLRIRLEDRTIIEIAILPAPGLPLRAFADSVVAARNAVARPAWRLGPPEARDVGGRTAWVLHPTCGDCRAVEAYLDFPSTRLVAAWGVDGEPPFSAAARDSIAWAFVRTLVPVPGMERPATRNPGDRAGVP